MASMKALPKRKGNFAGQVRGFPPLNRLNESPSKKEGKLVEALTLTCVLTCLNESPSKKEGKSQA